VQVGPLFVAKVDTSIIVDCRIDELVCRHIASSRVHRAGVLRGHIGAQHVVYKQMCVLGWGASAGIASRLNHVIAPSFGTVYSNLVFRPASFARERA